MLNCSASLAMSTSVLEALPGKLDIKRHSPSFLYLLQHKCQHCSLVLLYFSSLFATNMHPDQTALKKSVSAEGGS